MFPITINATIHVELASSSEVARINDKLDAILHNQEKLMADLSTEFSDFNAALTRQLNEINTQIQQVADAVKSGGDAIAVVEDARSKITAATAAIQTSADALAADNPPVV